MNKSTSLVLLLVVTVLMIVAIAFIKNLQQQVDQLSNDLQKAEERIERNRITSTLAFQQKQESKQEPFRAKGSIGFRTAKQ